MQPGPFFVFVLAVMFSQSLLSAASFSSFGKRSSLKKSSNCQDLSNLADQSAEIAGSSSHSDGSYLQDGFADGPTIFTEDMSFYPNCIEYPSELTIEWVKSHLIPQLHRGVHIPGNFFQKIINESSACFHVEETVQSISFEESSRLIVVGDVHGAFDAMIESIFEVNGYPSEDLLYVFNGDLVDRGTKSMECIITVLALKIAAPSHVFITRGNHESMTVLPGTFSDECRTKLFHIPNAFDIFHELFRKIPVGYVVNKRYFIAHGGLHASLNLASLVVAYRLEEGFERTKDVAALLWNDPYEDDHLDQMAPFDIYDSKTAIQSRGNLMLDENGMGPNPRGPGCHTFSSHVTKSFLCRHGLEMFIRSHQYVPDGYKYSHGGKCLTIFSSPEYVGMSNEGAVVMLSHTQPPTIIKMCRKDIFVNQSMTK